ncbi:MAG: SH3 domain-containing protein [Rhodomicrobiaceae bacterium]
MIARISDISALMRPVVLAAIVALTVALFPANAQDRVYGYYEVVGAENLNIRRNPYLTSEVVTVAPRGATLIKWRRFCSLRPWCPVQYGEERGWAGKAFLAEVEED